MELMKLYDDVFSITLEIERINQFWAKIRKLPLFLVVRSFSTECLLRISLYWLDASSIVMKWAQLWWSKLNSNIFSILIIYLITFIRLLYMLFNMIRSFSIERNNLYLLLSLNIRDCYCHYHQYLIDYVNIISTCVIC